MKQFLFILLTLTFSLICEIGYSQAKSDGLISELSQKEANLSRTQERKLVKLRSNKSFSDVRMVRIGNLRALEKRGALPIKIPGKVKSLVADRTHLQVSKNGDYQWRGSFRNDEGSVFINSNKEGVFGRINYLENTYLIEGVGEDKALLLLYDRELGVQTSCGSEEVFPIDEDEIKEKIGRTKSGCSNMPIRVGVMYTQAALSTGLNMSNLAQTAISDMNTMLTNSGISLQDVRFELAGVQMLNGFIETSNICADAVTYSNTTSANQYRDDVNVLADIMVLLTRGLNYGSIIGCAPYIGASNSNAYTVVKAEFTNYNYTFSHEVIHVMGGRHQQCDIYDYCCDGPFPGLCGNPNCQSGCDDSPGYNHGWAYRTGIWPFRKEKTTVMHQIRDGWTTQLELSNPSIHGRTNLNDNAQMIENNACNVAGYRINPMSGTINGPFIVNAYQTGTWNVSTQNCSGSTSVQWEYSYNGWSYTSGGTGNSFSLNILNHDNIYLRATVTCSDGQVITLFMTVFNDTVLPPSREEGGKVLKSLSGEASEAELNELNITAFPNPVQNSLNVEFLIEKGKEYSISIINIDGRVLYDKTIKAGFSGSYSEQIDVTWRSAVSHLIVSNGESISVEKIMVYE